MCAPAPPPAPDYAGAAKQQGEANLQAGQQQAVLNTPNTITPYGSTTVSYGETPNPYGGVSYSDQPDYQAYLDANPDVYQNALKNNKDPLAWAERHYGKNGVREGRELPMSQVANPDMVGGNYFGVDQPTVIQEFSPEQQSLYDSTNRISQDLLNTAETGLGRVSDSMATPFDMGQVHNYTVDPTVGGLDSISEALMAKAQPYLDTARDQELNNLMIQGHDRGGRAWDTSQRNIGDRGNRAIMDALLSAGQEQSRIGGMESARRGQDIQEQAYLRNLPLSEINALRTGNQPTMPMFQGYSGGGNVQPAPLFDATLAGGNFAQQNYANQLQSRGDLWGGLGQLGMGAAGIWG